MNGRALAKFGLVAGDCVRVSVHMELRDAESNHATLRCAQDETVADGCVRIAAAHASTAMLGPLFGGLAIEKVVDAMTSLSQTATAPA